MLDLSDGVTLYHGSTVPVQFPDLSKCSPRKDFGQAVYDDDLKLWWESPADIADAFLQGRPVC